MRSLGPRLIMYSALAASRLFLLTENQHAALSTRENGSFDPSLRSNGLPWPVRINTRELAELPDDRPDNTLGLELANWQYSR